jgi:NADPH-dependent glutamate synthase beta subunit-like oxidoreductase
MKNPHIIAIFGGAVSGAEAAHQLAQRGIRTVVFEQNALPYGKIEDGLPKWHAKLRDKEEANINEKLSHPLVSFVPMARLGQTIDFEEVAKKWGFSAVFLATGAWRDRPLSIEGIDDYLGRGLYYQNSFIYWYNHKHEPGFQGEKLEISDGALVIGGGLASIDVMKALMMETVEKALLERGHLVNMFDLERSIPKVLESLNLSLQDLGIKGCTLVYRRRVKDMPLFPGDTDTPEKLAKAEAVREKVLQNAQAKFLFNVLPCHVPVDKIVENGRLTGLVLRETQMENGRVSEIPGSDREFRTPLVVSSIGSIPFPIPGIPMRGQTFDVEGEECCRLKGYQHVFALGNAVTGRGNIKESMEHGRIVSESVAAAYLLDPDSNFSGLLRNREDTVNQSLKALLENLDSLTPPDEDKATAIFEKVNKLQSQAGYSGDYMAWIKTHLPVRLEEMVGEH